MNFDADVAYLIGHAVAQKFQPKKIEIVKRTTCYVTKSVVGQKYVKALQVMKSLRVI